MEPDEYLPFDGVATAAALVEAQRSLSGYFGLAFSDNHALFS